MTLVEEAIAYARQYLFDHYLVAELRGAEPIDQFQLHPVLKSHLGQSLSRMILEFGSVEKRDVALLLECFVLAHTLSGSISMLNHISRTLKMEG